MSSVVIPPFDFEKFLALEVNPNVLQCLIFLEFVLSFQVFWKDKSFSGACFIFPISKYPIVFLQTIRYSSDKK